MRYPFLPVNPCCTDVVLNTPCGCSSVMTTSGCNSNNPCSTQLTASSTIVYDGPTLSCIIAEPCDTLNIILQKIDNIICNLLTQVNYLTSQVNSITTQMIAINGDIINIHNVLDECCSATTTTSSTTLAPCESFLLTNVGESPVAIIITDCETQEQEAIVLLPGDTNICVVTDSPLTVPGTVIVTPTGNCNTTTTTTTSEPTTTTTTTAYPCECLSFYNSDVNSHSISYINCENTAITSINISAGETIRVCGCCGSSSNELVFISVGANCIDGECPSPTTTTTTTTVECDCYTTDITILSQTLAITDDSQITLFYKNCQGDQFTHKYSIAGIYTLDCVNLSVGITAVGTIDGVESSIFIPITAGESCCYVATTTTTTTPEPTTTTTTTADTSCTEVGIDAATLCLVEEYALVQYTDCEGNVQTIQTTPGELPIVCMLNSSTPVYLCGTGDFQYGGACSITTTTTTTIEPA